MIGPAAALCPCMPWGCGVTGALWP